MKAFGHLGSTCRSKPRGNARLRTSSVLRHYGRYHEHRFWDVGLPVNITQRAKALVWGAFESPGFYSPAVIVISPRSLALPEA